MKKNILAAFACAALATLGLTTTVEAVGTKGDIYSIAPVTVSGKEYKAGESFQFRVRLLASDYNAKQPSKWAAKYVGAGSETLDMAKFPPKLGVIVAGQLREAEIVGEEYGVSTTDPKAFPYTDLVCEYQVKSGDLALPALLAMEGSTLDKPLASGDIGAGTSLYVYNTDKWQYMDSTNGVCNFCYCDGTTIGNAYDLWKNKTAIGTSVSDPTLEKANFLAKGIDFDETTEKSQDGSVTAWRVVRENKESLKSSPAPIVTSGAPTKSMTLYVWSEDETAVRMAGSNAAEIDFPTNRAGTLAVKRWVTTIQTEEGKTDYSLSFKGVAKGKTAKIVLSPILGYRYKSSGDRIETAYLTREVYCDEPEKPNVQISFEKDSRDGGKTKKADTSLLPAGELGEDKIPLYITLSESYAEPVPIQLVVKSATAGAADPITNQNITVSQYEDFSTTDIAYTNLTISTGTDAVVYVYPIGGDLNTQNGGIDFSVVLTGAGKDHFTVGQSAKLILNGTKHKPTVTAMQEDLGAQEGTGFDVSLQVSDCYRDMQRKFKVDVTFSDGATMTTNLLFTESVPAAVRLTGYGVNATSASIKVTDDVGNVCAQSVVVKFSVKPQKTVVASLYDSTEEDSRHAGSKFREGDPAYVRFTLSEKLAVGSDRYAFLVPQNAASSNLVGCAAFTNGVLIAGGETNSYLTAACKLSLLDGCAETDGQKGILSYRIVLRTADTLSGGEEDTSFTDTQGVRFSVENLYPETKKIFVNNSSKPVTSGAACATPLPCDVEVPFLYQATDASEIDRTNGLISIWCFTEGRSPRQSYKYVAVTSKTETATCYHRFTTASAEQTVEMATIDKDILAELKPEGLRTETDVKELWPLILDRTTLYTFTVTVESKPHVVVELLNFTGDRLNRMDETGNEKTAAVRVSLSEPEPNNLNTYIRLIAKAWTEDEQYAGKLLFSNKQKLPASDPDYPNCPYVDLLVEAGNMEPQSQGNYKDGYVKFDYSTLDGSVGTEDDGWELIAKVLTAEKGSETYFSASDNNFIYVVNLAPTVKPKQPDILTTNKNQTVGKAFDIKWTPGDVVEDLKAQWGNDATKVGLKTVWYVNDAEVAGSEKYVTVGTDGKTADQQTTSITLNDEGLSVVKLVITDKDGEDYHGVIERTWLYFISPTKKLSVTPVGPGAATTPRYRGKGGSGLGRVYANGGGAVVSGFSQTWSYSISTVEGTVYAFGYASGDKRYPDDGKLGPDNGTYDLAITADGEKYQDGKAYYYYENNDYDNYFYRWARVLPSDNGGSPTIEYDSLNPSFKPLEPRKTTVTLDAYEEEKAGYATRQIEAVFSRELLTSDNCGDLNGDGVPDIYLLSYPDLGVTDADGADTGDDLLDVGRLNPDGDYLPNTMTAKYASFVPGLSNTWATVGRMFTTKMEIRGAGTGAEALNDAPAQAGVTGPAPERIYLDPDVAQFAPSSTVSHLEYVAYTNWCGRQGYAEADFTKHWKEWSPERPTDPTKADTDDDGLPDGYEYYFWYKAHVGQLEEGVDKDGNPVTNYVRITGRRYNPGDPCHPTEITADEIEKAYDPTVPAGADGFDVDRLDSDNDGLIDLLEFSIGTNPFDFDTDRDGLPDGYEVSITLTDPLDAESGPELNADGDCMAVTTLTMVPVRCAFTNAVKGDVAASLLQTNTLWVMSGDAAALKDFKEVELEGQIVSNLVSGVNLHSVWTYRIAGDTETLALGKRAVPSDDSTKLAIYSVGEPTEVRAHHYQVYGLKRYDPRTGWNVTPGVFVNATIYTAYDEFMSLAFFYQTGGLADGDLVPTDAKPWVTIWQQNTTDPLSPDTDGDNMPDGWEFYIMGGTTAGTFDDAHGWILDSGALNGKTPDNIYSPLFDFRKVTATELRDPDGDSHDFEQEWCGIDSCGYYPDLTNLFPDWRNKKWPTDPWNNDTDGDGLADGSEYTWLYGSSGVDGGGLNPLSWDTDLDGLPDPWELEFCGTFTANATTSATAGTNDTSSATNATSVATNATTTAGYFNSDGMNPTASDFMEDYDHDGLNNWQEYLVGAMRCWRYDDLTSPWVSHATLPSDVEAHLEDDDWWGHMLVERWADEPDANGYNEIPYNPGLCNGMFDPGVYFSCCWQPWDPAAGRFYMFKDGVYHDLRLDVIPVAKPLYNRWTYRLATLMPSWCQYTRGASVIYPVKYISCDPRLADTDNDGMDDYYELFHGLNPLLGKSGGFERSYGGLDIVFVAWGGSANFSPPSADENWWLTVSENSVKHGSFTGEAGDVRLKGMTDSLYDFYQFPWLAGLPTADPDGDNIRNQQESILPKVQAAPTYQHTDPTPLWMTDTSFDNSLTHRYYQIGNPDWADDARGVYTHPTGTFTYGDKTYSFNDFPWMSWSEKTHLLTIDYSINNWKNDSTMFSYEENEGYDSDHDYLSDFEESQARTKAASDPQQHDSPLRHQAMWFGGESQRSWLQTPLALDYAVPTDSAESEVRQAFLYYTVEAWVKPDAAVVSAGDGLFTVVERAIMTGASGPADESFLRKNFLIGIRNGRWYTKFDTTGTDLNQPVEITTGPAATTNWTHVAATFGPSDDNETGSEAKMELRLYVNGVMEKAWKTETSLQPEHGLSALVVDELGQLEEKNMWGHLNSKPLISILVGASAKTGMGVVFNHAWETRDQKVNGIWPYLGAATSEIDDYKAFFRGYIDEVRIWDGARKAADIKSDYDNRVRYTAALAEKNRQKVYEAFAEGALRSPSTEAGIRMPAELCYHWAFDHLPSATEPGLVLQTPAGFTTAETVTDAKAIWSRPADWKCTWWQCCPVASKVYANAAWVPWINDTVSHLPFYDGTTSDSVYWSSNYAGRVSATEAGYASFAFPRSAEVWSSQVLQRYTYESGPYTQVTRWNFVNDLASAATAADGDPVAAFRFARRNRYETGADLLPLGCAYPRRISSAEGGMWDDACASDAWAQTGPDGDGGDPDNDGLPTWWEELALERYSPELPAGSEDVLWDTTVTYDGRKMTAGAAYLRDLALGMLPDGERHVEYADTRDTDKDGVIDYYAELYNLADGHAGEDDDGDGLSNYAEYLITEVFGYGECDPEIYATDGKTCDYFLKVGELYLGEIFTDHDQMTDTWEAGYDASFVNRGVYDPLEDSDGDGWSNYAEFRAGTDPSTSEALSIDGYVCPEYPVPSVAANVIYNGATVIRKPLVFKAWNETTDYDMVKAPDAVWTLGETTGAESTDTGTESTATDTLVEREKFIGRKPSGVKTFYLSGGHVSEGSVKLLFLDKSFGIVTYDPLTQYIYPVDVGEPDDAVWYYHIIDKDGKLVRAGGSLYEAMGYEEVVVGSIDYLTGKVTIDFANEELCGQTLADPATAESTDDDETDDGDDEETGNTYHYINLDKSYVRIEWKASSSMATGAGVHYLSDPDEVSDASLSFGHLREGRNTFVCFVDDDENGEYTAGELFGVVRNVDVGWSGASFDVELTETHPISARIDLTGANDRSVWYGTDSDSLEVTQGAVEETGDEQTLSNGGKKMHVRVDRYAVNGLTIGTDSSSQVLMAMDNIVLDKWLTVGARTYIHEGDFMKDDEFDIDWKYFSDFTDDAAIKSTFGGEVVSVSYRVVIDNSNIVNPIGGSNTVLKVAFTRTFDLSTSRKLATPLKPEGVVYGARPTFRWTMRGYNTYTAFRLRVLAEDGTVVYQSPMTRVPPLEGTNYVWRAPFSIGDQTPQGKVLARTGNFSWCVSMYNSKFQTDSYCTPLAFSTAVGAQQETDDHGYGAVKVAVRYAGPVAVLKDVADLAKCTGKVRVQAFENPDFSGVPESETYASDLTALTTLTNLEANATLYGLKAGTYYIRAFIDTDGDFAKDDWESWGCAPSSATVVSARVPETVTVWIEDADTDCDWLPDAWEQVTYGSLAHENASVDADGRIILKTATYESIKKGYASISSALPGASLTLFENLDAAKLLLDLGSATTTDTIAAIRDAVRKRITPGSVKITKLTLNAAEKRISMSVAANAAEQESLFSAVYEVPDATTVTVNVYRADKPNATDDEWTLVDAETVQVNAALDATFEIPLDVDLTGGFYKVEVVE